MAGMVTPAPGQFDAQAPGVTAATGTAPEGLDNDLHSLEQQLAELQVKVQQKRAEADSVAPYSRSFNRTLLGTLFSASGGLGLIDQDVRVGCWVKTGREAGGGSFAFLEVNDGSCLANLQVFVSTEVAAGVGGLKALTSTGTSILVQGTLRRTPEGTLQKVELKASKILWLGKCDNGKGKYPLSKKGQGMESLRERLHLRPRTNLIAAVARIRNALAHATHTFFQSRGFLYVHTPLITTSDCEGAGEMFQVTTLLSHVEQVSKAALPDQAQLDTLRSNVAKQQQKVDQLSTPQPSANGTEAGDDTGKAKGADKALRKEAGRLTKLQEELERLEARSRVEGGLYRTKQGGVDYSRDFFGKAAFLTVSGQLQAEYFATALSNVYTFAPTFRAEDSHTSRHLAEFWMIEPEMAFCTLEDDMNCAEDYVRFCCQHLLDHCQEDLNYFTTAKIDGHSDPEVKNRLQHVAQSGFKRISYTEAIDILSEAIEEFKPQKKGDELFEFPVKWGIDLSSEHERYLAERVFKSPVIVYNYPKDIKAFYMRLNDDGKTVAAMDVLVPGVGELIGGSQREERLDVLQKRLQESGMPLEPYAAYMDIREYGTVPHAGFGLGFERLILFATGLENIREAIPFPRWPGHAEC
ncbi:hypothetical protein ABBQ32_008084 [Trebouxia sp. C0010 RCD-2024]